MYIVVELYDGEVNIDICANIESALYKKKEYIDSLKENFNFSFQSNCACFPKEVSDFTASFFLFGLKYSANFSCFKI